MVLSLDPLISPRMNILFIGDIFASAGRSIVAEHLPGLVRQHQVDLVIANGENSAGGFGITPLISEELLALGIDVLTGGNHSFDKREIHEYLSPAAAAATRKLCDRAVRRGVYTGETKRVSLCGSQHSGAGGDDEPRLPFSQG